VAAHGTDGAVAAAAEAIGNDGDGLGGQFALEIGATGMGIAVALRAEAEVVLIAAVRAGPVEVGAAEPVGHTAGRDNERLDDEGADEKS